MKMPAHGSRKGEQAKAKNNTGTRKKARNELTISELRVEIKGNGVTGLP